MVGVGARCGICGHDWVCKGVVMVFDKFPLRDMKVVLNSVLIIVLFVLDQLVEKD